MVLDATFVERSELSHEKSMRVQALLHLRDFLSTPLTIPEGLAIGLPMLDCYPSFFCFGFLVIRASSLVPDRHFALLLDKKMYLMSPVVAM